MEERSTDSSPSDQPPRLHVVLVEPEIAANVGSIGRTCVAVGARLWLVRPLGFHLTDRHRRRAGLDYWDRLDFRVVDGWDEIVAVLGVDRLWSFSTKAEMLYTQASYRVGDALVLRSGESRSARAHLERFDRPKPRGPNSHEAGGAQFELGVRRRRRHVRVSIRHRRLSRGKPPRTCAQGPGRRRFRDLKAR